MWFSRLFKPNACSAACSHDHDLPHAHGGTGAAETIAQFQREAEDCRSRIELLRLVSGEGLWDAQVNQLDPGNPDNPFCWSGQFRRMLGFDTEAQFPNVLGSWASRLHPDDGQNALDVFICHLSDRSAMTPYDEAYRLRCKDGLYRWFRARAQTRRAADGMSLRSVGALTNIDSGKRAELAEQKQQAYQVKLDGNIKDIAEIVATIEQIARQTNLIALNASVEAGRAGSDASGMAGEVWRLSARANEATEAILRIRKKLQNSPLE